MNCPNRSCRYLQRYGFPAEWPRGTVSCPDCGSPLETDRSADPGNDDETAPVTIAWFDDTHEAHLAKGRLEAEGMMAQVSGEHLANLHVMFADAGSIRLEVARGDVDRALGVLDEDHSGATVEEDERAAPTPASTLVCRRCCSAAVAAEENEGLGILGRIMAAVRGRPYRCLTCGLRWRPRTPDN